MRTLVGAGILVLGIILVISGLNASDSLSSRLSRLFTGSPTDRTIWLLIGGVLGIVVGAAMVFPRRGQRT